MAPELSFPLVSRKANERKMWMSEAQEAREGPLGNHMGVDVQIMGG